MAETIDYYDKIADAVEILSGDSSHVNDQKTSTTDYYKRIADALQRMVEQGSLTDFHNDIEDLKNMVHNLQLGVSRYGVKFTGSDPTGERLYNAKGLTAAVGTDTQDAYNDFDYIEPWSLMRRCNTAIVDGQRVPTYFEGEAGYSNTNADVFVYVPRFYYYRSEDDSEHVVSMTKLDGYRAPSKFIRSDGSQRDFCFLAAYAMGLDNGVPVSRSGYRPVEMNLNSFMTTCAEQHSAETLDSDLWVESMKDDEIKTVLLSIEFGTRNLQDYMLSACYLIPEQIHIQSGGVNQFTIVEKDLIEEGMFIPGQAFCIEVNRLTDHTKTEPYGIISSVNSSTGLITFIPSENDVTVSTDNAIFGAPWKTGTCDNVISSSGSPISNMTGFNPCVWRGCENPWGNGSRWRWDYLYHDSQSYVLTDPTRYSNTFNEYYTKLSYQVLTKYPPRLVAGAGYGYNINRLGFDPNFPYVRIATEVNPDEFTTYFTDSYSAPFGDSVLSIGGFTRGAWWDGPYCQNTSSLSFSILTAYAALSPL